MADCVAICGGIISNVGHQVTRPLLQGKVLPSIKAKLLAKAPRRVTCTEDCIGQEND